MGNMFSQERVNTGRQLEIDLAKTVTIILMVWTHVYEFISTSFEPSLSSINAYVTGSIICAVTFMFCMGIGLTYTRHNSAEECFRRGIRLFTAGLALCMFRDVLPASFLYVVSKDMEQASNLVLGVECDILHFAGLAFLLVGLLKKMNVGNVGMLLISVGLSVVGTLLEGISTGCFPVDQFLGFLWGTESNSYFPLFNWFIFVAAGQWFGDKYQFLQDKKKFHLISLLAGIVLCVVYLYVSFNFDQNVFKGLLSERFLAHRPFFDAIIVIPVNVALISLFYFIGLLIPQKAVPVFTHPSKHINQYYCISWVIICYVSYFSIRFASLSSDLEVLTASICILLATILAVIIYTRYLQQSMDAFFGKRRVFWSVLVWIICIASFAWAMCNFDIYPTFLNGYVFG